MSHRLAAVLAAAVALALPATSHAAFSMSGSYTTDSAGSIREALTAAADNSGTLQCLRQSLPSGITPSNIATSGSPANCAPGAPGEIGCEFPSPGLGPGQSFELTFTPSSPPPQGTAFDVFVCMFPCDGNDHGPFSITPAQTPGPSGGGTNGAEIQRKARIAIDDFVNSTPFDSGPVVLGFGLVVINGSTDGVNLRACIVNAQNSAQEVNVFGFEAQPLLSSGSTQRAVSPMYRGTVVLQPGEAKVLKFKPPKKIARKIRTALKAGRAVRRKITLTYATSTGQSQKVTRKLVVKPNAR